VIVGGVDLLGRCDAQQCEVVRQRPERSVGLELNGDVVNRDDLRHAFERRSDDIVELAKLGVFVVFGSLLTFGGLFGDGWAAVALVVVALLIARPVALAVALAGTGLDRPTKAFMAWFGPKGVATMTFSIIVLGNQLAAGGRIFNLAALVVFVSIIVHSSTDQAGVAWIARRRAARDAGP
jgi:NhaP-type Na+/H+ and K+/H+ antiporter